MSQRGGVTSTGGCCDSHCASMSYTVWDADAAEACPDQVEFGHGRNLLIDSDKTLEVTNLVLRVQAWPSVHAFETRPFGDTEQRG